MIRCVMLCVLGSVLLMGGGCEGRGDNNQSVIDSAIANGNAAVVLSDNSKWYDMTSASLDGNVGSIAVDGAKEIVPGSYTLHVSYHGEGGGFYYDGSDSLTFTASKGEVVSIALQGGEEPSSFISDTPHLVRVQ